jgi:hypothetical protein
MADPTRLEIAVGFLTAALPVYAAKGYPRGQTRLGVVASAFDMAEDILRESDERTRLDNLKRKPAP